VASKQRQQEFWRIDLKEFSEEDLVRLRALLEVEMNRRGVAFSIGEIGESLVIDYFNRTAGLPNLQRAPAGTKNVDALSREGDRYSIKTVWRARKTGTVYPDAENRDKQLFEYLIVARLSDQLCLESLHLYDWRTFREVRSWDKRMGAWYIGLSNRNLHQARQVLPSLAPPLDQSPNNRLHDGRANCIPD